MYPPSLERAIHSNQFWVVSFEVGWQKYSSSLLKKKLTHSLPKNSKAPPKPSLDVVWFNLGSIHDPVGQSWENFLVIPVIPKKFHEQLPSGMFNDVHNLNDSYVFYYVVLIYLAISPFLCVHLAIFHHFLQFPVDSNEKTMVFFFQGRRSLQHRRCGATCLDKESLHGKLNATIVGQIKCNMIYIYFFSVLIHTCRIL